MTEILGNDSLLASLRQIARLGQVSHSYILNGSEGTGKRLIADWFARLLQCTGTEKPCGRCLSCLQAASGSHPDIIHVGHEKPNLISVDDIRIGINQTMQVRPYSGQYKIYIVDEAEKMNVQAQNALLKTIEEPPEYGVILLLTTNAASFLPTILSRCVRLDVRPLPDEKVAELLISRSVPEADARRIARLSGGSCGRAFSMSESESFRGMSELVFGVLRQLDHLRIKDIHAFLNEMGKYKEETESALALMELWFRDVLVLTARQDVKYLQFREERESMTEIAAHIKPDGILKIFDAIQETRDRLNANVNYELSIELLLLTMRDSISRPRAAAAERRTAWQQ